MADEPDPEPSLDDITSAVDGQKDALARLAGLRSPDDPYFEPIPIEVPKGKLVSLHAAVMTAHQFTAIVMFRSLPKMLEDGILSIGKKVGEFVAKKGALALVKFVTSFLKWVLTVADAFNLEAKGREMEQRIRKASALCRKELIEHALAQKRTGRHTRRVHSRHKSKPQRKANKSWQTTAARQR